MTDYPFHWTGPTGAKAHLRHCGHGGMDLKYVATWEQPCGTCKAVWTHRVNALARAMRNGADGVDAFMRAVKVETPEHASEEAKRRAVAVGVALIRQATVRAAA